MHLTRSFYQSLMELSLFTSIMTLDDMDYAKTLYFLFYAIYVRYVLPIKQLLSIWRLYKPVNCPIVNGSVPIHHSIRSHILLRPRSLKLPYAVISYPLRNCNANIMRVKAAVRQSPKVLILLISNASTLAHRIWRYYWTTVII
jgi:hypothetical protein